MCLTFSSEPTQIWGFVVTVTVCFSLKHHFRGRPSEKVLVSSSTAHVTRWHSDLWMCLEGMIFVRVHQCNCAFHSGDAYRSWSLSPLTVFVVFHWETMGSLEVWLCSASLIWFNTSVKTLQRFTVFVPKILHLPLSATAFEVRTNALL